MIDREKIELTMSTIAVLAPPPKEPIPVDQKELLQVLRQPFTIGQGAEGILIGSQRDQIEVIAGGNKLNVRDLSGRQDFSQSKIPNVLHFFLRWFQPGITSYGINLMLTLPCKGSNQWLSDNIFAPRITERTGRTLIGGSALLRTRHEQKVWNIKLEPAGDTMSVDFNASEELQRLPEQEKLCQELQEQFESLIEFLGQLGL